MAVVLCSSIDPLTDWGGEWNEIGVAYCVIPLNNRNGRQLQQQQPVGLYRYGRREKKKMAARSICYFFFFFSFFSFVSLFIWVAEGLRTKVYFNGFCLSLSAIGVPSATTTRRQQERETSWLGPTSARSRWALMSSFPPIHPHNLRQPRWPKNQRMFSSSLLHLERGRYVSTCVFLLRAQSDEFGSTYRRSNCSSSSSRSNSWNK